MFAGSSRLILARAKSSSNLGVQGPPVISDLLFLFVHRWCAWLSSAFDWAQLPVVRAEDTAEATAEAVVFADTPMSTTVPFATLTWARAPAPTDNPPRAPPPAKAKRGGDSRAHKPPPGTSGSPL